MTKAKELNVWIFSEPDQVERLSSFGFAECANALFNKIPFDTHSVAEKAERTRENEKKKKIVTKDIIKML